MSYRTAKSSHRELFDQLFFCLCVCFCSIFCVKMRRMRYCTAMLTFEFKENVFFPPVSFDIWNYYEFMNCTVWISLLFFILFSINSLGMYFLVCLLIFVQKWLFTLICPRYRGNVRGDARWAVIGPEGRRGEVFLGGEGGTAPNV